jgi:dTDP-D-glucose 4,6-dehydratase
MIGFAPEVEFEEGLRRTVDWFTAQYLPAQLQVAV